jgi:hypothetical protein
MVSIYYTLLRPSIADDGVLQQIWHVNIGP